MSERFYRTVLGADPSAVGGPVSFDGQAYTVIGVASVDFEDPITSIVPFRLDPPDAWRADPPSFDPLRQARSTNNTWTIARLAPGASGDSRRARRSRARRYEEPRSRSSAWSRMSAVRLACGARSADLTRSVITGALRLSTIGIAIGIGAALAFGRLLASSLHDVSPADPLVLAGVTVLLIAVTVLATVPTVRRVLAVEPASVLRSE